MFDVLVIGSINADLVFTSLRRPLAGETVIGNDFKIIPGGKGANQAVAAARLGCRVGFIGCLGNDSNGELLLDNFISQGVITEHIKIIEDKPSGVAGIILAEGDNSIIVIPGSNHSLTNKMIDDKKEVIKNSRMAIIQLEIPLDVVEHTIKLCCENNIPVILNPAPAFELSTDTLDMATYLTPNEHEFKILFGDSDRDEVLRKYPNKLIITEGDKGAVYFDGDKIVRVEAYRVEPVDTTGAGDTFNGALAAALIEGQDLNKSLIFASRAAALSVTKLGAQSGMPYRNEI